MVDMNCFDGADNVCVCGVPASVSHAVNAVRDGRRPIQTLQGMQLVEFAYDVVD